MKKILRKKWFWVLTIILLLAGCVIWRLYPRRYDITVSRDTTYLLSPLHPDGTVNYVAAMDQKYSEGITVKNNAVPLLIRAGGPVRFTHHIKRVGVLKRIGVKPPPMTGDYSKDIAGYFVGLAEYISQKDGEEPSTYNERKQHEEKVEKKLDEVMTAPWSAKDYPTVAEWLEANEKPLSLVVSATRRPRYYLPIITNDNPPTVLGILFPSITVYKHMTKALSARAMLKTEEGNIEAARADLLAAHRLARLIGQEPILASRLTAINSDRAACKGSAALAASGKLTAAQANDFLADLRALPIVPSPVDAIDQCERFVSLDMVAIYARQSWKRKPFSLSWGELFEGEINADWDEVLRKINYFYDLQVAAMRKRTFSERRTALAEFEKAWEQYSDKINAKGNRFLRSRDEAVNIVVCICAPCGYSGVSMFHDRGLMHFRLVQATLALAACKAERGRYPARLAELKPKYLKKIPNDLFTEKPLRYQKTGKGYLLYSVGPNMKDDGGRGQDEGCDDIAVRAK